MTAGVGGQRSGPCIVTKEHRRFTECAHARRQQRTIGVCFGPAGVGKTLSARRHANWVLAEPLLHTWGPREPSDDQGYAALARSRTVFYTPTVGGTLRELRKDLHLMTSRVESCIEQQHGLNSDGQRGVARDRMIELIIIDEAERLSTSALEHLRDLFDRTPLGVMLMGMPGIAKRLARIRSFTAGSASRITTVRCKMTSSPLC
jgi:DNA transposition AAA+ family ATPase